MPMGYRCPDEARLESFGPIALPGLKVWQDLPTWWLRHTKGANTPNWDIALSCEVEGQDGPRRRILDFYGRPKDVGEWALHLQCNWRIVAGDRVTVGSVDLQYPADYTGEESIPDDFDWERDPNRRDSRLNELFMDGSREFTVRNVAIGYGGACAIDFEAGMRLEVVPMDSMAHEHWRLFATGGSGPEIVVSGVRSAVD
jgi:hypothetical protein